MNTAPNIEESTIEERREYIKNRYPCISDCDMCGLCKVFHGKDPENAYVDYINGKRSFMDVSEDYKHQKGLKAVGMHSSDLSDGDTCHDEIIRK